MNNQEYIDTFDEVKILYVEGVGKREVATILSCEDFNDMTPKAVSLLLRSTGHS